MAFLKFLPFLNTLRQLLLICQSENTGKPILFAIYVNVLKKQWKSLSYTVNTHWQSPWVSGLRKLIHSTAKPVNLFSVFHNDLFDQQATFISEDAFHPRTWNSEIPIEVGTEYRKKEIFLSIIYWKHCKCKDHTLEEW